MPTSTSTSPRDVILHRRSPVLNKRPLTTDLQYGEIAVNYNEDEVSLYIKDYENAVRKVGGVFYSDSAPDPSVLSAGYQNLSHGELWVKRISPPEEGSDQEEDAHLFIFNKYINSGSGGWLEIGKFRFALVDEYLDQFKDATDGSDYIHTVRNELRINNKAALKGFATSIPSDDETDTSKADTLVINDEHNFATGVLLNANNLTIDSSDIDVTSDSVVINSETTSLFQTDSATGTAETTFTYNDHGLFNGEEIFVEQYLNDGTTPSGVTQGNYTVAEASLNTFKLYDGSQNVLATGNVRIKYSPRLILDQAYNVLQSGNFRLKEIADVPNPSQIAEGRWDVYRNSLNGNVRVYARANNIVSEATSRAIKLDVKNASGLPIAQGAPVYFAGTDPIKGYTIVGPSLASNSGSMNAIGITDTAIVGNGYGSVTVLGETTLLDTTSIGDQIPNSDDSGKVVYVAENGGLTFTPPTEAQGIRQPIGVLFKEDSSEGKIFVNHPDIHNTVQLEEGYMWIGATGDNAVAYRINTDNFQRVAASDGEIEFQLSDEIKFGAYEFLWDGDNTESKTQTKVTTSSQAFGNVDEITVDSFPSTYRSAKFFVQLSLTGIGITPNFQVTELLVIHNGTDVDIVDYGTASTLNERLGDFSGSINGSNIDITFQRYGATEGQIEVKVMRTAVIS